MCPFSMTVWSSQGLLAHYINKSEGEVDVEHKLCLIDQTVPLSDPFYCQYLKLSSKSSLSLLQWNASGNYLLLAHKNGFIEIFHQTVGLINQFKSVFKSEMIEQLEPICAIWCENLRKFSFNYSTILNNSTASPSSNYNSTTTNANILHSNPTLFTSKSVHVDFVPPGRIGFLLITANGSVHIYVENFSNFIETESEKISFDVKNCQIDLDGPLESSGTFARQRSDGKIIIFVQTVLSWSIFELNNRSTTFTGSDFTICPISKLSRDKGDPIQNNFVIDKFVWLEGKNSLVNLKIENNLLYINTLDLNFSITSCVVSKEKLPIVSENICNSSIFYSSRASSYLFLESTKSQILMLNFNGDLLKTLKLDREIYQNSSFTSFDSDLEVELNDSLNQLIISPNGLCVGRVLEIEDFPILIYSSVGEINPKNIAVLREFLGKMISSCLNQCDSWDIFRVIQKTFINLKLKTKSKIKSKSSEDSENINSFISTLLAEWINLLESSNIPSRDFYNKLLDFFRCLPIEFSDAYDVVDLTIKFLNIEKVILSTCNFSRMSSFEDSESLKWPEIDQISPIETENLVSLLPVLEEGLKSIGMILKANNINCNKLYADMSHQPQPQPHHQNQLYALFPLNDEIYKSFGVIISTAQAAIKQFENLSRNEKSSSYENVFLFYKQAEESLKIELNKLNLETFNKNNLDNYDPIFINFLSNLRSDPQIQSKCSKNLFLFLIDFFLDSQNLKKVFGNVMRVFSRYNAQENECCYDYDNDYTDSRSNNITNDKNFYFHDSIKCLDIKIHENCVLYICRKCKRISTSASTMKHTKKELIFSATWQQNLWKSRCPCGSLRRIIRIKSNN